jgi:hypothetical protein
MWLGSAGETSRIEAAVLGSLEATAIQRGHRPEWVRRLCRMVRGELRRPGHRFKLSYFINRAMAVVMVQVGDESELCLRLVAEPPAASGERVGPCVLCCRFNFYRPGHRFRYALIR